MRNKLLFATIPCALLMLCLFCFFRGNTVGTFEHDGLIASVVWRVIPNIDAIPPHSGHSYYEYGDIYFQDGVAVFFDIDTAKSLLIDKNGKAVKPEHDVTIPRFLFHAGQLPNAFHDGLISAVKNDKWGFVDTNGEVAIPFEYDYTGIFSEGLCYVVKDDKHGFIDKTGETVISLDVTNIPSYLELHDKTALFSEGLARIYSWKDGNLTCNFINKFGELVIPASSTARDFFDGLAYDYWSFIDKTGAMVITFHDLFQHVGNFSEGLARVKKGDSYNSKWGFINKAGELVIPLKYDDVKYFKEDLACVRQGDCWGFIDKDGEVVIPFEYEQADSFSEGLAPVSKDGKYGFIDRTGRIVVPLEYDKALSFSGGLALVHKSNWWGDGKWGILEIVQ